MWVRASHQPAATSQMTLPSSEKMPEFGFSMTSRPNGQAA